MTTRAPSLIKKLLPAIAAAILLSPPVAAARPLPLSISQKIHNLEAILSYSAKKPNHEAEFEKIHQMLEDAEVALKTEDTATAEKLYSQAWEAYQATARSGHTKDNKTTQQKALASKLTTAKVLLKRLEEIETDDPAKKAQQIEGVRSLLAQAEASDDSAKALGLADQAYYIMKILVKDVRNGKTLTFDHTFATPAQKYADEVAYNDMHFGLLNTALEQLHAQADTEYNNLVTNAKLLREQAEEAAEEKDYKSAIDTLSRSTIEIKKALKHLGLAVPGI